MFDFYRRLWINILRYIAALYFLSIQLKKTGCTKNKVQSEKRKCDHFGHMPMGRINQAKARICQPATQTGVSDVFIIDVIPFRQAGDVYYLND